MAGSSLFVLIDDIAALLDDIASMTKIAAQKTAGVLGDDLALNAQQVSGIHADRELPVIWAVAKGSLVNKIILVPAALAISAFIPWLITPLLIIGGLFLCYEGVEKIIHTFFSHSHQEKQQHHDELLNAVNNPDIDILAFEKEKISGAIRTDFILSAEIIAITLGVVASEPLITQAGVLSTVALLVTIIVYGLVGGIVRLDDWGLYLHKKTGDSFYASSQRKLGYGILQAAPILMKTLSIVGTAAMFLVGGGILTHGITFLHHIVEVVVNFVQTIPTLGGVLSAITPILLDGIIGVIAGLIVVVIIGGIKKVITAVK